jgi:hypothetical protein
LNWVGNCNELNAGMLFSSLLHYMHHSYGLFQAMQQMGMLE